MEGRSERSKKERRKKGRKGREIGREGGWREGRRKVGWLIVFHSQK